MARKDFKRFNSEMELELSTECSPMNINSYEAISVDMGVLQSENMWLESSTIFENDGARGVSLHLMRPGSILNGPLGDCYQFKELHFHWGFNDQDGSEHSIDNEFGVMEAHFVFTREYKIWTDIEYLETAKRVDDKIAAKSAVKAARSARSQTDASLKQMEETVDEIEEKMILDRWQKEKARKALQNRRPTKFEFETLPSYKELDHSVDIGYKDDEEIRRQAMSQDDFNKFKDLLKMQQLARKCAERKAHLDSKNEYIKWKAKEDIVDDRIKQKKDAEEEKTKTDETLISKHTSFDLMERKRRKERATHLYRERIKRDTANKIFDESLKLRRVVELNHIQMRSIKLVCNIALLFHVDDNAPNYQTFAHLSLVNEPFTQLAIDTNLLEEFKDCLLSPNYYAYHSQQSPSENQGLLWIVMKDSFPIRKSQIDRLRQIKSLDGQPMKSTRRVTRDNVKRKVYMNWRPPVVKDFVCPGADKCHCDGKPDKKLWEQ